MHIPLDETNLLPGGPLRRVGAQLLRFDELDSTNTAGLARAAELPDGAIIVAEFQTAGRGRRGHAWQSPRGASILLSVLLKEPAHSPLIRRATMLAALAACEAIETACPCRPVLRWPNDMMLSGRKLGGVLVESSPLAGVAAGQPSRALVLGIGINCLQQAGHFEGELAGRATSLEIESPQPVDRAAVGRALLERLDEHLVQLAAPDGPAHLLAAWKIRCADFGRHVTLQHDRRTFCGTVLDITDQGDLLVELERGGRRCFAAATTTRTA